MSIPEVMSVDDIDQETYMQLVSFDKLQQMAFVKYDSMVTSVNVIMYYTLTKEQWNPKDDPPAELRNEPSVLAKGSEADEHGARAPVNRMKCATSKNELT